MSETLTVQQRPDQRHTLRERVAAEAAERYLALMGTFQADVVQHKLAQVVGRDRDAGPQFARLERRVKRVDLRVEAGGPAVSTRISSRVRF